MYYKMHQKQMEAQQDNAWMYSVPEWHNAELAGQNKPWTVPSQLLTAEEEVRHSVPHHKCTHGVSISVLDDTPDPNLACLNANYATAKLKRYQTCVSLSPAFVNRMTLTAHQLSCSLQHRLAWFPHDRVCCHAMTPLLGRHVF